MGRSIKPIETTYRGYRFRSRLEARWAVYFDTLQLDWDYELEGFNLGDGILYLPDFWIPQVRLWAEVKPEEFTELEMRKVEKLVELTRKGCLLLVGVPDYKSYGLVRPESRLYNEKSSLTDCVISNFGDYPKDEHRFYTDTGGRDFTFHKEVEQAVTAARSARFEHGENPWR